MNLLLLEKISDTYEIGADHPRHDSLSRLGGPQVCVGVVGGPRGIGDLEQGRDGCVRIYNLRWETIRPPSPPPLDLAVGLPRPAEARRILFLAGLWGVQSIGFLQLERTPSGYATSKVLEREAVRSTLYEGVEQGFHTRLPVYRGVEGLAELLADSSGRITVLDPYLGEELLKGPVDEAGLPQMLLLGGERGFSSKEQELIRDGGASRRHLGPIILRSEAALSTALPLIFRESGFLNSSASACIQGT